MHPIYAKTYPSTVIWPSGPLNLPCTVTLERSRGLEINVGHHALSDVFTDCHSKGYILPHASSLEGARTFSESSYVYSHVGTAK